MNIKGFFKSLFCSKYKDKVEHLEVENGYLSDLVVDLEERLLSVKVKKDAAEEALREALVKDESFNILDLEDWYLDRFSRVGPWYYNAFSQGNVEVSSVIRRGKQEPIIELAYEFIDRYNLKVGVTPEEVIEVVARHFMQRTNWRYTTDQQLYGRPEYWASPEESIEKGFRGDCDSLAILMHNLIYYLFQELELEEHYWRLKFTASGTMVEAHAYNIWLGEDGYWYVLESTLDLAGSFNKTWLRTPINYNNLYGSPWGFGDRLSSWRGLVSSLQPYKNNSSVE